MNSKNYAVRLVEQVLFNVRWALSLFYFALVLVLVMYSLSFVQELWHIFKHSMSLNMDQMKIVVLDVVDIVMIANLVKMIITGSYNSFVSKDHGHKNENVSSGTLKVKISSSIIVVALIHLLKSFVNEDVSLLLVQKQLMIFSAFLLGSLVLGLLEYIHVKQEVLEHDKNVHTDSH